MKKILVFLIALISVSPLFAKITFGPSDLNKNDEVLFTLKQEMAGIRTYNSLFYSKIVNGESSGNPALLTCYPEQLELLNNKNVLQIRNRYGEGQYDIKQDTFRWVKTADKIPETSLPLNPYSVSPDGKYLCRIEKESLSSGTLYLVEVETNKKYVLASGVRQNYDSIPVKWCADSSILLYEKDSFVYFCKPEAITRNVEMDEKYRKIGRGSINSVNWATEKQLIYIDDYLVYQINAKELYTIGLYSGIIGQGKAIGRLPSQFNAFTDKFSVNSTVSSIILIQNDRLFSYMRFQSKSCDYLDVIYSKPYIDSTASLISSYVFWDKNSEPYLWFEKLPFNGSKEKGVVYRLSSKATTVLEIADSGKPILSPDGSKAAFYSASSIYVYDTTSWQRLAELSGEKVVSAVWSSNSTIFVGGEKTIKKWDLLSNKAQVVMLSSAEYGFWDKANNSIMADTGSKSYYKYNKEFGTWKNDKAPAEDVIFTTSNGRYRVFKGTTANKQFENALYIRTLSKKAVTKPMYKQSVTKGDAPKKVALVIDAYDNADGLTQIIYVLQKYNVPVTFFINGEFIRRYPNETRQIVNNGYETGSMFFTTTDLVNNDFVVDEDFIRRGLARNEDEFFQCTGKELSLFWHAPYYSQNQSIVSYGNAAGYNYVNSSMKNNTDTLLLEKDTKPEKLIHTYCETLKKNGGGIVPVTAGFSQGNRTDPLYNYLDLLICALVDGGFEFVGMNDL
ncbi:MAG: polysaccharide deacetylase family protein [Treponema sp.]|nr:polysaccharide deacetylase family protein [Treponema sp.]